MNCPVFEIIGDNLWEDATKSLISGSATFEQWLEKHEGMHYHGAQLGHLYWLDCVFTQFVMHIEHFTTV